MGGLYLILIDGRIEQEMLVELTGEYIRAGYNTINITFPIIISSSNFMDAFLDLATQVEQQGLLLDHYLAVDQIYGELDIIFTQEQYQLI